MKGCLRCALWLCTRPNFTLAHILTGCPWVLTVENKLAREDRNTWRHNCVLLSLATRILQKVKVVNSSPILQRSKSFIKFLRAGMKPGPRSSQASIALGILSEARDWECLFDLPEFISPGSKYVFPHDVDTTDLRCDAHIISRSKKICIVIELTVPMEDNIEYWHTFKLEKYMAALMNVKDWTFHYLVLEVGCRGWIPPRFFSLMRQLGFSSREVRGMHDNAQLIARKCSYVIWLNRYNKDFHPIRISISDGPVVSTQLNDPVTSPQLNDSVTSTDVVGKSAAVHSKLSGKDKERADRNRLLAISRRNAKSSSILNIVSASDSVHSKLSGKDKERADRNRLLAISGRNTTSSSTSTKLSVEEKVVVDRNRRLALHRLRAKNSKHAVGVISKPFTPQLWTRWTLVQLMLLPSCRISQLGTRLI